MGFWDDLVQESSFSKASGNALPYVVLQVTLKEKFFGTGSGNLAELESLINQQVQKGCDILPPPTLKLRGGGFLFE